MVKTENNNLLILLLIILIITICIIDNWDKIKILIKKILKKNEK